MRRHTKTGRYISERQAKERQQDDEQHVELRAVCEKNSSRSLKSETT
jgi:hypothetical protein